MGSSPPPTLSGERRLLDLEFRLTEPSVIPGKRNRRVFTAQFADLAGGDVVSITRTLQEAQTNPHFDTSQLWAGHPVLEDFFEAEMCQFVIDGERLLGSLIERTHIDSSYFTYLSAYTLHKHRTTPNSVRALFVVITKFDSIRYLGTFPNDRESLTTWQSALLSLVEQKFPNFTSALRDYRSRFPHANIQFVPAWVRIERDNQGRPSLRPSRLPSFEAQTVAPIPLDPGPGESVLQPQSGVGPSISRQASGTNRQHASIPLSFSSKLLQEYIQLMTST